MDIPNRLPPPEKRKDKISKNDMRYLYKLQKSKNKTVKRAKIDEEINEENRRSEKRARTSVMGKVKPAPRFNISHTFAKKPSSKKKMAPEVRLFQLSQRVFEGDMHMPCILDGGLVPPTTAEEPQPSLTEEEIVALDPAAIVWNAWDYPHIIAHEQLWVFCIRCHRGMPSTAVRHHVPNHRTFVVEKGDEHFGRCGPIFRWTLYHDACYDQAVKAGEIPPDIGK